MEALLLGAPKRHASVTGLLLCGDGGSPLAEATAYLLQLLLELDGADEQGPPHRVLHLHEVREHIVLGEDLARGCAARHAATYRSAGSRQLDCLRSAS